jgi:hypothetical protein
MELKSLKRLDSGKLLLDGLVWDTNTNNFIKFKT